MQVNVGDLNRRVQIVRLTHSTDADGYKTAAETVIREPWTQFSRVSPTERQERGADMEDVSARFLVRWSRTGISRKDLVRYDGQDYEIQSVNDYGDGHEYVELLCRLVSLEG